MSKNQELCQNVKAFTEQILTSIFEDIANSETGEPIFNSADGDESDSIGYSLFLASCIIQVKNVFILEFAKSVLIPERLHCLSTGETFITVMGSLSIYAACFFVDPQVAQSFLTDELVEIITKIVKPKWFTNYRNMVIGKNYWDQKNHSMLLLSE